MSGKFKKFIFTPVFKKVASSLIALMIKCKKHPITTIFGVAILALIIWMIKHKKYPIITAPSTNFTTKGAYFLVGVFIFLLVMLILSKKKWGEKKNVKKIANGGDNDKGDKRKKLTWGGRITWAVIIILFIIPLVWGIGLLIWPRTYNSIRTKISSLNELSIPATFDWELDGTQSGRVRSNFMETIITYNNDSRFSFVTYYDYNGKQQKAFFDGNKNQITGRIEGFWHQDCPADRGKWYLEPDQYSFSTKTPEKWVGKQYSRDMWIRFTLKKKQY